MRSYEPMKHDALPLWELGEATASWPAGSSRLGKKIDLEGQGQDPAVALAWTRSRARRA